MIGYYDLILGLIPASFFGVAGLLAGAGVELAVAVPVAAAIAAALVGHAMFVRAPADASLTPPAAD